MSFLSHLPSSLNRLLLFSLISIVLSFLAYDTTSPSYYCWAFTPSSSPFIRHWQQQPQPTSPSSRHQRQVISWRHVIPSVALSTLPCKSHPLQRSAYSYYAINNHRHYHRTNHPSNHDVVVLYSSNKNNDDKDDETDDIFFQGRATIALIAGQGLLAVVAVAVAYLFHVPNFGLGSTFLLGWGQVNASILATLPLILIAYLLDRFVEPHVPWLQDVTLATQRSILALLGGTWKPLLAIMVSLLLSLAAGIGEEILFRGVLQYELIQRWNSVTFGLLFSSVVFGSLHAVTPLYAILATVASLYFGWLFLSFDNLAVPMITHTLYDFGAILYAHYTVSQMTASEQVELANWQGPGTSSTSTDN